MLTVNICDNMLGDLATHTLSSLVSFAMHVDHTHLST